MSIKKCECGCDTFTLVEYSTYKASIKEDGTLEAYTCQDNGYDSITCRQCGKEYSPEDFAEIEFNY